MRKLAMASVGLAALFSSFAPPALAGSVQIKWTPGWDVCASSCDVNVNEQLNFGLTRRLSLSGGFSYLHQLGDGVFVLNSNRRFATAGITWSGQQPTRK